MSKYVNGRFIFHNPHHYYWFKKPSGLQLGGKIHPKYSYLLDHFMDKGEKIFVYLDRYRDKGSWYSLKQNLHPIIGFYAWVLRNQINPFRFSVILNPNKINKEDKLFIFLFGTFTNESGVLSNQRMKSNLIMKDIEAYKIVHCTHYMYHADIASKNLKLVDPDLLVAEGNLKNSSQFFQENFKWYIKQFYLLPFVTNKRFHKIKEFKCRISKAFAMGSIVEPIQSDIFKKSFGGGVLQPMRVVLYENKNTIENYIYSIISYVNDPAEKGKTYQKNYFSKNIVELYNDYKMFIVPE
jgi:hypothetical protein